MAGKVRLVGVFIKGEFEKIEVNRLCWTIQAQHGQEKCRQVVLIWADWGVTYLFVSQIPWKKLGATNDALMVFDD